VYVHIDSDPICSRLSGEIIVELCSNAIKHGKAQKIWVAVSLVGDRIASVIVKNDGEGLKPEASGFGSQLIEQSCLNREQFEVEGLTVVTVTVPFSAAE
jgi:two-component sensor histidine kinase